LETTYRVEVRVGVRVRIKVKVKDHKTRHIMTRKTQNKTHKGEEKDKTTQDNSRLEEE
jgi:hypothetical protein